MIDRAIADIPESYLEYRAEFAPPMFEVWTLPNPLVAALHSSLRKWNVGMGEITWNKDAGTYKDLQITFTVSKMNALIKFGVDSATFIAVNPDWPEAPALTELFETAMRTIQQTSKGQIASQWLALAMHVKPGPKPFRDLMAMLVNTGALGPGQMYGVSVYQQDSSFVIDKSARYPDCVFVRLQRTFGPSISFSEIAKTVYEDESRALGLLGLEEPLEG